MNKLYRQYKDRAEFYVVYIQEAHPSDLWQLDSNIEDTVVYTSPKGYEERVNLAGTCAVNLGIEFPALVDDMRNSTEITYTGWPDRLYVIDTDGRIAHKSAAGPFGFKPEKVRETLKQLAGPPAEEEPVQVSEPST